MRNGKGRSNTGICSASIPRFVHIRKAVDTYQNIRHKGYKGWDPRAEMVSGAVFPRIDQACHCASPAMCTYETGRKVARSCWGVVRSWQQRF